MHRILALILVGALSSHGAAYAQSEAAAEAGSRVTRLDQPIAFDGRVDDVAWESISPIPMRRHWPSFSDEMAERSDIRLAYDDDYLYVSARCYDSMPITETSYKRDDWSDQDDQFALVVDSYNDHENAMVFVLYSTGARIDASVSNDARTGNDVSTDWNTFWDGAVSRDEHGWYGEMRIPWSSLRFEPAENGQVTMGVGAYRYIARLHELHVYPSVPPDWGYWSFIKPSKGDRTTFDGLQARRALYVTPYLSAGLGQDFRLNESETRFIRRDDPTYDAGFDLKYGLTSNLTLDLTVNTDFAQVEADNQQINLTRFSLFFPEKRQFFLERTTNFEFSFGENDRVFYSRRIGIHDGQVIQLIGGGRIVGRVGGWDVGLLAMQSARDKGLASEHFGVLRLKRQVFNANSYVGGIATTRLDFQGRYNTVYGLDGLINLTGDEYLRFNWAQSLESDVSEAIGSIESARFRLLWQRAKEIGFAYEAGVARSGALYDPGIGFQLRHDFTELSGAVSVGWRPPSTATVSKNVLKLDNALFLRNDGSGLETAQVQGLYAVTMSDGSEGSGGVTLYVEDLAGDFYLSDASIIRAGKYRYVDAMASWTTSAGRRLRTGVMLQGGGFFDGTRISASVSPSWSISPKLEVTATYGLDRIRFLERARDFDAHLLQMRADVMLSTLVTISSFVQYNSSNDAAIVNGRLRINPREGNDFYLVYNEGFNTDRYASDPLLPLSSSRTVIAKYTYTFHR